MDQELKNYLDQSFRELREENARQIGELREETSRQIGELREETSRQFREAREETSRQFGEVREETSRQFGEVREETSRQFGEVREGNRQTRVLLEGVRSDLQLLAEGVIAVGERFASHRAEVQLSLDKIEGLVAPCYRNLDSRVSALEEKMDWPQDPLKLIRQKYGKG